MTDQLKQRLLSINKLKPFVWKLRLTKNEYDQLKNFVENYNHQAIDSEYATLAIIYIAEWYKREYDGNVSNPLENLSAEYLWEISGLDASTYVYKAKKTSRWLESIFMLGGLPMNFILNRNDTKLLKALCILYKDDNATLEDKKDIIKDIGKEKAIAFQESIHQYHSLYQFLKTLLLGDASDLYAQEDLAEKTSPANRFVEAVKSAYVEVMREKFRHEWIVDYNPSSPYMHRMLRLWLKPEELGGLHQYLRFERARSWKIPKLMQQRVLRVSLQFKKGDKVVGNDDTRRTIMTFENTGQDDTGFEATGSVPWAMLKAIPAEPFDRINVIITDDNGQSHEVQHFDCKKDYLQLWAMQGEVNRWTTIRANQSETAVIYTNYYKVVEGEEHTSKPFYDKTNGLTESWNFAIIEDNIQLRHGNDAPITLWNRQGYIQFSPKLYNNVIRYKSGKVRYMYNEDPDIYSEPETEEWYPVVFQRSDIKAYHFATRDMNDQPDAEVIEKIEFKPFSAHNTEGYQEWTNDNPPRYGRLKLRLTIKDERKIYPILYLPSMLEHECDEPIIRDFENNVLQYVDETNNIAQVKIDVPMDKKPLGITKPLRVWGNENEYVELDAFLPTLIKEVLLDGQITKYIRDGEIFVLPYLLRNRVTIHDYNRDGYSEYECFNVGVLNEIGSINRWENGAQLITKDETQKKPEYIHLAYGNPENTGDVRKMIYWDYSIENPPVEVDIPYNSMAEYSILFQDMRQINDNLDCIPPETSNEWSSEDWNSEWDMDGIIANENNEPDATLLRCYDIATEYKTYYFIFNPLFNMSLEEFINDICLPLRKRHNNTLTEEDMQNLMRCATECGLDWVKISTKIINNKR